MPGPIGAVKAAAETYMKLAGLPYTPPTEYLKVDKERAGRIATAFEAMKHDPNDPATKASYAALAKEVAAQWNTVKSTGLKIEFIKEGQPDPYATSLRMAAMDVIHNNHLWVFPTTLGFGSGTEGAAEAKNDNPMLQDTGEVLDGHKLLVNDQFRIVHDYFGHFKEGVGFRADGEENAWRSHAAMFTPLARAALTSETRGQNSWLNFGPPAEHNKTASPADTIYAPQKIGVMEDWTADEGRLDPGKVDKAFDPDEPRDETGKWTSGGGGDSTHPGEGYSASARLIDGVIHTSNVYDAQRALFENRKVELSQIKQVSTLIRRLGETAAEMAEHGETAPVFNLCNVSVKGTNLFCAESKGIPRVEMPVIARKATKDFVKHLKKLGYKIEKDSEQAANLRATQNEISGAKVAASMARIEQEGFYKRLVISRDDYILDGHHTWAGQLGLDARDNNLDDKKSVKVWRVDISITKLIEEADKWTGGAGKKPASEVPKSFRQMTLREASIVLPPTLFRKYYMRVQEFFDANAHLARDCIDSVVIVVRWDESQHPRVPAGSSEGGQFGEGGGETSPEGTSENFDPKVVEVGGDEWNRATARKLEREYQAAKPKLDKIANNAVKESQLSDELEAPAVAEWNALSHDEQLEAFNVWRKENKIDDYDEAKAQWDALSDAEKAKINAQQLSMTGDTDEDEDAPYYPDSWEGIGNDKQEEIYEAWKEDNHKKFLEDEEQSWFDNGGAQAEAKNIVAYDFKDDKAPEWAVSALDDLQGERDDDGKPLPFTTKQILDSMEIEYEDNHGDGSDDPDMGFDATKLDKLTPKGVDPAQMTMPGMEAPAPSELLTQDMRDEITKVLTKAFNYEAEHKQVEPPDYLGDNVDEYMDQYWGEMSDKQKFNWAYDNDQVDKPPSESNDTPSKPVDPMRVEALPAKYDPLNETTGVDYVRTQKLAHYLSVVRARELILERLDKKPEEMSRDTVARLDKKLWVEWKGSSTSEDGRLLQVATAEELGGRLNLRTATGLHVDELKSYADSQYKAAGGYKGVLAYIRAKWETSQYLLDKAGQHELELYRGLDLARNNKDTFDAAMKEKSARAKQMIDVEYSSGSKNQYTKLPTVKVDRNGAASTTTDITVANGWAKGGAGKITLRAVVPRTAAISIPAYGINVHGEHEVVIAGTAWTGWDAWAGTAPPLDKLPIGPKGTGIGTSAPLQQAA